MAAFSIRRQCAILNINRSSYYYEPKPETEQNLKLMRIIDETYLADPSSGSRRMTSYLNQKGYAVNRKRVQRLMRLMRLEAIYPKPDLSRPRREHAVYPYLLRGLFINRPNQVWSTDISVPQQAA